MNNRSILAAGLLAVATIVTAEEPVLRCLGTCDCENEVGVDAGVIDMWEENYHNLETCAWVISGGGNVIEAEFTKFALEAGDENGDIYDYVNVFECTSVACTESTKLGTLFGVFENEQFFITTENYMMITFSSDGLTTDSGFKMAWTVSS